jgi:hypothetical protein
LRPQDTGRKGATIDEGQISSVTAPPEHSLLIQINQHAGCGGKNAPASLKRERRMLIVPLGGSRSEERTSSRSAKARIAKSAKRSAVPWHERLLLAGLLLVVVGWIVLRSLQMLLGAS